MTEIFNPEDEINLSPEGVTLSSTYLCYGLNYKNLVKPSLLTDEINLHTFYKYTFISYNHFDKVSKRSIEFLQPPYTGNYFVWRNVVFFFNLLRRKNQTVCYSENLPEEVTKYDDANELKEEKRNELYLVEISIIALRRTIFLDHKRGESELVSSALW
jgi:hypothetical protein